MGIIERKFMGIMSAIDIEAQQWIRDNYNIDWNKFDEIVKAASYELYYGPMEPGYWDNVDPLNFYKWSNWNKAINDIRDMMENLPVSIFYNYYDDSFVAEPDDLDRRCEFFEAIDGDDWMPIEVTNLVIHSVNLCQYI
jgi:hypothetical protein